MLLLHERTEKSKNQLSWSKNIWLYFLNLQYSSHNLLTFSNDPGGVPSCCWYSNLVQQTRYEIA
jgi:hypothetical protein